MWSYHPGSMEQLSDWSWPPQSPSSNSPEVLSVDNDLSRTQSFLYGSLMATYADKKKFSLDSRPCWPWSSPGVDSHLSPQPCLQSTFFSSCHLSSTRHLSSYKLSRECGMLPFGSTAGLWASSSFLSTWSTFICPILTRGMTSHGWNQSWQWLRVAVPPLPPCHTKNRQPGTSLRAHSLPHIFWEEQHNCL